MKLVRRRPVLLDFGADAGHGGDGDPMSSLILIADDDRESVETLDAALRREGLRTVVADDGHAGETGAHD